MSRTQAPTDNQVDLVIKQLKADPDLVITAVVNNSYKAVLARYNQVTGNTASIGTAKLAASLKAMRKQGRGLQVLYCISVPWEAHGNTALSVAVSTLRSESSTRTSGGPIGAKNLPTDPVYYGPGGAPDFTSVPGATETGGAGATNDFWNSLPGILTAAGGLVGAFTGNVPGGGANGTVQPPPPEKKNSSWLIIGLVIIVVIAGVVYLIRAAKK